MYVFDVNQTEGKELPALTEVRGDVSGYRERLIEYVDSRNIKLNYSEKIAPAKGMSYGGKITLLTGMEPAEEFSTLVHETAHEMLHKTDRRTLVMALDHHAISRSEIGTGTRTSQKHWHRRRIALSHRLPLPFDADRRRSVRGPLATLG